MEIVARETGGRRRVNEPEKDKKYKPMSTVLAGSSPPDWTTRHLSTASRAADQAMTLLGSAPYPTLSGRNELNLWCCQQQMYRHVCSAVGGLQIR